MEAIILAGGKGTRLQTVVSDVPKPMAPINDRPFLEIILDKLVSQNVTHVVLSVGYMYDKITSYFGSKYKNINISYSIEIQPLGTGGAIKQALKLCQYHYVMVINGDSYFDVDYSRVYNLFIKSKDPCLVLKQMEDVSRYGSVTIQNNYIASFNEKGLSGKGLINGGCYFVPKDFFPASMIKEKFSFEEFLENYVSNKNKLCYYISDGKFIDIGIPSDYKNAQLSLQ